LSELSEQHDIALRQAPVFDDLSQVVDYLLTGTR